MAEAFTWFRGLHMLFALLWGGAAIYRLTVVEMMMRQDSGFRDRFFAYSRHGPFMGITATLTFILGLVAMLQGEYGFENFATKLSFFAFHGAIGMATFALIIGWSIHFPIDIKAAPLARARLAGEDHDEDRYLRLLDRDALAYKFSGVFTLLAILGMTGFRYLA